MCVGPDSLVAPICCILFHPASGAFRLLDFGMTLHESSKVFVEHARMLLGYGLEPRPNNHALQRARLSSSVYQSMDTRTRINLIDGRKQD